MAVFDWIHDELASLEQAGLRRSVRCCEPLSGGRCRIEGQTLVNLASNDYLGLASDPRVIAAGVAALQQSGCGARASALVSGRGPLHVALECALSQFERTEAAVLFPTGYAANLGVIAALVEAGDVVLCDRLNHASLIDGCRLSGAKLRVYSHADLTGLEIELEKSRPARRRLIVTDSVFSMDGDLAPLPQLAKLADHYNAMLVVDEAHATGIFGPTGRGLHEELTGNRAHCLVTGTLSKAIGSQGGFVVGSRAVCDWIRNRARTQLFSTGLTPAACGTALAALEIIDREPERRKRVHVQAQQLRSALRSAGHQPIGDERCPIVPLIIGDPAETVRWSNRLMDQGYLVPAIRPPTVPNGGSRLRISLTADHHPDALRGLVTALRSS